MEAGIPKGRLDTVSPLICRYQECKDQREWAMKSPGTGPKCIRVICIQIEDYARRALFPPSRLSAHAGSCFSIPRNYLLIRREAWN
ncbi:hypothetical protein Zmor_008031 [Zophobas morio]|uniref:Uncharacterized protein n=1 Tax=Zophobas morio TaxID=2755281 RepID=A0AA38ITZ3_9CUCU|nr:hypothetical protein Zmor_008031 [Zophobas morio]